MAIQDSDTLKSYFNLRKVITPSNYDDLIDTIFAQSSAGEIAGLTISSNPGASASILATNPEGAVSLLRINTDVIRDRSGSNLTLSPSGDIALNPGGNDIYPLTNHDLNLGLINKKFLAIHAAELWVETLVAASTIGTIGGRILVGPTTELTSDLSSEDTTIFVKHDELAVNDTVYLEANGQVEFMLVISTPTGTGPYGYNVTRNRDGGGAHQWYAGDAVFNTGNVGDGFIDLYSYRGIKSSSQYGPSIVGNVRNSVYYNDWTEYWAIGNLNGIYGYGTDLYGAAFGKYGSDHMTIDSTNGIRFLDVDDFVVAKWDTTSLRIGQEAVNQGNVLIEDGSISLRMNITERVKINSDGDLFIGEDISAAATTFMSVFVNAQTYNGEAVSAGDVLLGDNSSSKANILWDKSVGKLLFRGGTTTQLEIDTTGALIAGDGAVVLDVEGLKLAATYGPYGSGSINWWNGTQRELSIGLLTNLGNPVASYFDSHYGMEFIINTADETFLVFFESTSTTSRFQVSNGDAWIGEDVRVGRGLYVGDTSLNTDPGDGNIEYTGALKSYKNSTFYTGYIFVPLSAPLTSTSWDGDAYSTTAKTVIDLSAVFGVPAGVKSVLAKLIVRDTASATNECWIILGPSNTAGQGLTQRCGGNANNFWTAGTHVVPCDANGDIYYQIQASGSNTFTVYLEIWGYWI